MTFEGRWNTRRTGRCWLRGGARVTRLLLIVGAVVLAGCGAEIPNVPEGDPVSYSAHLEPLVTAHCLSCHESEDPKAKLILDPGEGYDQLVGRRSIQVPEMALVEPGDPDASYLWLKLQHRAPKGKGMPRTLTGTKELRPAELELYRRWIEEGALP
jgi:hypothetical protein